MATRRASAKRTRGLSSDSKNSESVESYERLRIVPVALLPIAEDR